MSGVLERELTLGFEHVDRHGHLRTSALFTLVQGAGTQHMELLGMGRERTLAQGILWVIARQRACVERLPVFGERITLRTWPGEMMHVLFPRYCELLGQNGETLVRSAAVWALMERDTRELIFPEERGLSVEGVHTGRELPCLAKLRLLETPQQETFTVPYSYVDFNGHMNNTRCFDLAEDLIPAAKDGKMLREAIVEYRAEALCGDTLHLRWGEENGLYYVNSKTTRPCFRMNLRYEEAKAEVL